MKKGVIEVQFNWIFVLITGAVILFFFFSIVKMQKQFSTIKVSSSVKTDLKTILVGARASTETASLIDLSNTEIEYDCDGYHIGDLEPISPEVGFSPSLIKGFDLMLWSLDWSVPFRATNFLYFTSPAVRYIIVDDDIASYSFAEQLNESLPPAKIIKNDEEKILMRKELISGPLEIEDENNYKVKFIFINSLPSDTALTNLQGMKNEDVSAINISPKTQDIFEHGELQFYIKNDNNWNLVNSSYYIGKASLIAAIFAEDFERYNCNMQHAFEKLEFITTIYLNRTLILMDSYSAYNNPCKNYYYSAKTPLENINSKSYLLSKDFSYPSSESFVLSLKDDIPNLKKKNQNLIKYSCPEIY